jgi:hypothetical protein
MSNLENLRKQAKQYLRWHREQYYPVAAIIREHVPRFCQLSDQEILAAPFGWPTRRNSSRAKRASRDGRR